MNKAVFINVIGALIFLCSPLHATNGTMRFPSTEYEEKNYDFTPRALLIFLDDSETDVHAISKDLLMALAQKAGPILVSGSLLKNVLSAGSASANPDNVYSLVTKFNRLLSTKERTPNEIAEFKQIYVKSSQFDPADWILKEVSDSLYLLINNDYLKEPQINLTPTDISFNNSGNVASDIELKFGLKVNHMRTISFSDFLSKRFQQRQLADYFTEALNKSPLFCTKKDYQRRDKNIKLPLWSLYINGHGRSKHSIAGLQIIDFKAWLKFLDTEINCRLLIVSSCYSAGINIELIYRDIEEKIPKIYSFAVIIKALSDSETYANSPTIRVENNILKMNTSFDYALLLDRITASSVNYVEVAKTLGSDILEDEPLLRLPGTEWFSVIDASKKIVSIGSILAQTHASSKKLNIGTFFKKTIPEILLLNAHSIPFEVALNPTLRAIISMLPGESIQTLNKLSSTAKTAQEIINLFFSLDSLEPKKVFFISEIWGKDKKISNVIIDLDKKRRYAYFQQAGRVMVMGPAQEARMIEDDAAQQNYKIRSQMLYDKMKKKITKFTSLNLDNSNQDFYNSAYIDELQIDHFATALINGLGISARKYNSLFWILKLKALYNPKSMGEIKGFKSEEPITLENVIIDPSMISSDGHLDYYYTFDNQFYRTGKKIDDDYKAKYEPFMSKTLLNEGPTRPLSTLGTGNLEEVKLGLQNILAQRYGSIKTQSIIEKAQKKALQANLPDYNILKKNLATRSQEAIATASKGIFHKDENIRWAALDLFLELLKNGQGFSEALNLAASGITEHNLDNRKFAFDLFLILLALDKSESTKKKISELLIMETLPRIYEKEFQKIMPNIAD